jgi:hypothetical protein
MHQKEQYQYQVRDWWTVRCRQFRCVSGGHRLRRSSIQTFSFFAMSSDVRMPVEGLIRLLAITSDVRMPTEGLIGFSSANRLLGFLVSWTRPIMK